MKNTLDRSWICPCDDVRKMALCPCGLPLMESWRWSYLLRVWPVFLKAVRRKGWGTASANGSWRWPWRLVMWCGNNDQPTESEERLFSQGLQESQTPSLHLAETPRLAEAWKAFWWKMKRCQGCPMRGCGQGRIEVGHSMWLRGGAYSAFSGWT